MLKIPQNATPARFVSCQMVRTFATEMYISKAKKYRDLGDGTAIAYDYYRLTKSYIDKDGKTKHRSVLCLGELPDFDKAELDEKLSFDYLQRAFAACAECL